ncbi:hypothetical protein F5Y10DRAFT_272166 [Nemania abortiva]|nr:hypothetical protein F5Y10DRAFT_272166 [Nemania abortiva]
MAVQVSFAHPSAAELKRRQSSIKFVQEVHPKKLLRAVNERCLQKALRQNGTELLKTPVPVPNYEESDDSGSSTDDTLTNPSWEEGLQVELSKKDLGHRVRAAPSRVSDTEELKKKVWNAEFLRAAEEAARSGQSDAISDSSFTPSTKLNSCNCVQIDEGGRRYVPTPLQTRPTVPWRKGRFVWVDLYGRKHLLPPPGFRDVFPQPLDERPLDPPTVSFERKEVFKKPEVEIGGISLAVMQAGLSPAQKARRTRPSVVRSHVKPETPGVPTNLPAAWPEGSRPVAGWSSPFQKSLYEIEDDLVGNGYWPVSTF